jgi:hypothetical protein
MTDAPPAQETHFLPLSDAREAVLAGGITSVLAQQCALGVVERNVEIKVVAPLLELLGWDPVLEIHWGFRIPVVLADGTRAKREADVVIADENQVYLVGEVKAARLDGDPWAAIMQLLNYMHALGAARGFITNGHTWLLINDRPLPQQHPFTPDTFDHISAVIEATSESFTGFLAEIRLHLARREITPRGWSLPGAYYSGFTGRNLLPLDPRGWSPIGCDPGDRLIRGLIRMSQAKPAYLNMCATIAGLMLCSTAVWSRDRGSRHDKIGNVLLTLNHGDSLGTLYVSAAALRNLGCLGVMTEETLRISDELRRHPGGKVVDDFLYSLETTLSGSLAFQRHAREPSNPTQTHSPRPDKARPGAARTSY